MGYSTGGGHYNEVSGTIGINIYRGRNVIMAGKGKKKEANNLGALGQPLKVQEKQKMLGRHEIG